MITEDELLARVGALTIAVQALYLAHPNREAAVHQLQRLADGAADVMLGKAIPDATLDHLQATLRDFIAAVS